MKKNPELSMPGYSWRAAISGALAAAGGAAVLVNSAPQRKPDARRDGKTVLRSFSESAEMSSW